MTEIADYPEGLLDESQRAPRIDLAAAELAAASFLRALGFSCDNESMSKSPRRMAEAYAALFTARKFEMATFPNDEDYDEPAVAGRVLR